MSVRKHGSRDQRSMDHGTVVLTGLLVPSGGPCERWILTSSSCSFLHQDGEETDNVPGNALLFAAEAPEARQLLNDLPRPLGSSQRLLRSRLSSWVSTSILGHCGFFTCDEALVLWQECHRT